MYIRTHTRTFDSTSLLWMVYVQVAAFENWGYTTGQTLVGRSMALSDKSIRHFNPLAVEDPALDQILV